MIMQFVNNLYQGAQDYWKEVPANTGRQMIYNAGFGFIVETIFTGSPAKGVASAAVTALATAIYALVTPAFKELFNSTHLNWGGEMCRTFTAIIGAGCVSAAFGNRAILDKIGFLAIIWGIITYANPLRGDLNSTQFLVLFPSVNVPHQV
jgi:hypothetical protein